MCLSYFSLITWKCKLEYLADLLLGNQSGYLAVYAAKKYDHYRKPNLGLWKRMRMDLAQRYGHPLIN
jgi:bifunctional polynucleotide phosphatase/kinase